MSKAGSSLDIKDLNSLNFKEQLDENATNTAHSVDGALKAAEGAKVTIQNVKTINFGDNDHVLKADQGFHACGGTIDVTADNIYGNVRGSGFLMNQSVVNEGNIHQGTLIIHANKDINLTSNYRGLVGVQSYQKTPGDKNTAKTSITADGTIGLHVTGAEEKKAVIDMIVGPWRGGPLKGEGNIDLTIDGKQGVTIKNDNGIGIYNNLNIGDTDKNTSNLQINSDKGDVSIESNGNSIQSSISNVKNSQAKSTINVFGNNVNVVSKTGKAILLARNTTMTLGANKENGTIHISGANAAADVGTGSQLTIGNGTNDTTVDLQGKIMVSGGGKVIVKDKTTTIVNANSLGKNPLVSATNGGTFTADGNAKLVVKGADTGDTLYTKDGGKVDFWDVKNTSFDNPFQYLSTDGKVQADITDANRQSVASYIAPAVAVAATKQNDKNMSSLLRNGKDSYNGAVGIGQLGGIQHGTYAMTGLFTDALTAHDDTPDTDIWAKGFHSKESIDGLGFDGGALSMDAQYNGTVIGADLYQKQGKKAGVAMIYADGNVDSNNGGVYTQNDAKYLGASLYGQKTADSYRLATDVSYLGGSHDLKQYNGSQTITAKPDTEAWTVGVKAMKDYDFTHGTLTPYVGFRYLRLTTDGYTSSLGLSYDKENQNIYLLPVGVDYAMHFNRGSWDIKPYAGLSYIWTMGDRNADQTVSYGNATDVFSYDVSDAGSFLGKVGVSATKGDYTFGFGYAYQTGSTTDSHTWIAQASYAF